MGEGSGFVEKPMTPEAFCDHFILDHHLLPAAEREKLEPVAPSSIYEVIKILDGVPIFFEDHMARLRQSLRLSGASMPFTEAEILSDIRRLEEVTRCGRVNARIVLIPRADVPGLRIDFFRTPPPDAVAYARGIRTILFSGERETPNVKTFRDSFKERVRAALTAASAYEALLLDEHGNITEGSRSNLFFLREGSLHTPPAERVLLGVTRRKVMDLCRAHGIAVTEECLHRSGLDALQGAFITGTTVDVLPVAAIGEQRLESAASPLIQKIIWEFAEEVARYIEQRKSASG